MALQERQPLHEYFRTLMTTVVGQAFDAAGYELLEQPSQWIGGLFRYRKSLDGNLYAFIEFQVLVYTDTMWTSGMPSRFRIYLMRSEQPTGQPGQHPGSVRRTLSALVVKDFGVPILPTDDHWWPFKDTDSLGKALAEAGHLAVGYGIPWLSGDLKPPDSTS